MYDYTFVGFDDNDRKECLKLRSALIFDPDNPQSDDNGWLLDVNENMSISRTGHTLITVPKRWAHGHKIEALC